DTLSSMNRAIGRIPRTLLFTMVIGMSVTALALEPRGPVGLGQTSRCKRDNILVLQGDLEADGVERTALLIGNLTVAQSGPQNLSMVALAPPQVAWSVSITSHSEQALETKTYEMVHGRMAQPTLWIDRMPDSYASRMSGSFQVHELTFEDGRLKTAL